VSKTEQELRLIVKCLPPSPFHDKADEVVERAIAELRRLRISQLRRMADAADAQRDDLIGYRITEDAPIGSFLWRMARRKWWLAKFVAACLAEIERLRGEG
jgi:hypothetical protein